MNLCSVTVHISEEYTLMYWPFSDCTALRYWSRWIYSLEMNSWNIQFGFERRFFGHVSDSVFMQAAANRFVKIELFLKINIQLKIAHEIEYS